MRSRLLPHPHSKASRAAPRARAPHELLANAVYFRASAMGACEWVIRNFLPVREGSSALTRASLLRESLCAKLPRLQPLILALFSLSLSSHTHSFNLTRTLSACPAQVMMWMGNWRGVWVGSGWQPLRPNGKLNWT